MGALTMGAYLVDNPPRIRQYRLPRRAKPSGVIVVHTAESFPDETGPDTGAENVADFIRRRTNYGSYHDLADSDSIIQLVPYDAEAFHDASGSNPHSYGVSAATMAHRWTSLGDRWVDATVRNMARAAARYARWVKTHHGITIPARRITRAQSENRVPGFISHAERDPDRRADPGPHFPWSTFLRYYAAEMAGTTTPPPTPKDWFDMATEADLKKAVLEAVAALATKADVKAVADKVPTAEENRKEFWYGVPVTDKQSGAVAKDFMTWLQDYVRRDTARAASYSAQALTVLGGLDVDKLAAAIVAKLPNGQAIDKATVIAGVREALGSLDEE